VLLNATVLTALQALYNQRIPGVRTLSPMRRVPRLVSRFKTSKRISHSSRGEAAGIKDFTWHDLRPFVADHEGRLASVCRRIVGHWAARYDVLAWLLTRGRERELRESIVRLAISLKPGNDVLDIGCETGTLAITATRHVGPTGAVTRIDHPLQVLFSIHASPRFVNSRASDRTITASVPSVETAGAIDRTLHPMARTALRSM
jgi:SAM-dependent methyltransferase